MDLAVFVIELLVRGIQMALDSFLALFSGFEFMTKHSLNGSDCTQLGVSKDKVVFPGGCVLLEDILKLTVDEQSCSGVELVYFPKNAQTRRRSEKRQKLHFDSPTEADKFTAEVRTKLARKASPHLFDGKARNRVLVIVNPYSGQKKATKCWTDEVKPTLSLAGIETDLIETQRPNHGVQIALQCDIDKYDAVLIDSGDGLVSEFLNGILLRRDRERALKFPICHVPGGTSNALAAAVCFLCNEPFPSWSLFAREMTLMITRPRFLPLRMFRVETEKNGTKPMFLSANWGLLADIDIGSERFRWAGLLRLHIEAWIRVMNLSNSCRYRGRISYIPLNDNSVIRKTKLLLDAPRNSFGHDHFKYDDVSPASVNLREEDSDLKSIDEALEHSEYYKIPALSEPLDSKWISFETDLVMVSVVTLSHLSSDCVYLPSSRLDDDFMYLTFIDWATVNSRFQVADLCLSFDTSKHLPNKCLQIIPVRACRIEPLGPQKCSGFFAVDGEALQNNTAFQVVPTRHCATVVGRDEVTHTDL